MCKTTVDPHDDAEEMMSRYIAEAGDPAIAPSGEHVAAVRSLLLARLVSVSPSPIVRRSRAKLLLGAGIASIVALLFYTTLFRPTSVVAEVVEAMREHPCLHGRFASPQGDAEIWLSTNLESAGDHSEQKFHFFDYKRNSLTTYVEADDTIYHLSRIPNQTDEFDLLRVWHLLLLDPKRIDQDSLPRVFIVDQSEQIVFDGSKKRIEIRFIFGSTVDATVEPVSLRILVDPQTRLPDSIVVEGDGGQMKGTFDYPERGPADIYDLGVPRTAKVVDRKLTTDVAPILEAFQAERLEFDDYCAFVVEERILPTNYYPKNQAYRIWRKGEKCRIDHYLPGQGQWEWAPPADADIDWWNEHQNEFAFSPLAISNGKVWWEYSLAPNWKPGMPLPKPGRKNASGSIRGPRPLEGRGDIPYWGRDLFPEHVGHPMQLIGADETSELTVDHTGVGGPPGTLLLRRRNLDPTHPFPDHLKIWIDPAVSHLAMRSEVTVPDPDEKVKGYWLAVNIIEQVERSPKGHSYPTVTRQLARNETHEKLYKVVVDFDSPIPDELFEPLK